VTELVEEGQVLGDDVDGSAGPGSEHLCQCRRVRQFASRGAALGSTHPGKATGRRATGSGARRRRCQTTSTVWVSP
jgi:hypothetical protein